MFYISEISYRLFYFILAIIINLVLLYIYKNDIIFITVIPILLKNNLLDYFIFTEPREILFFYLYSCFNFLLFILVPYLLIVFFDYIKTASYIKEWYKLRILRYKLFICYFSINFLTFFIGLPIFWEFFSSFQNNSKLFSFFLELSALNYFYYFNSIFILTNFLLGLLIVGFFFFIRKGVLTVIINKSYIYFLFLMFSTLVTPPDLLLQILLFCSLYICFELSIFFILIYYFYVNKNK